MTAILETVRAEWSFDFAAACQRLAGRQLTPEPDQFILAMEELAEQVPWQLTSAETLGLRDRLVIATQRAAQQFHAQFHRCVSGPCRSSPLAHGVAIAWGDLDDDPKPLLVDWAARFIEDFNRSHTWPAPIRAAHIIRTCFTKPLNVRAIAREVGCGSGGLIRAFGRAFGVPMRNYQTRCRIRMAIPLLRERGSKVEAVARQVGYRSAKNFYRALRRLTGITPSSVREMSDLEATELLASVLSLPQPFNAGSALFQSAISKRQPAIPGVA